jgi:hypothetical protein
MVDALIDPTEFRDRIESHNHEARKHIIEAHNWVPVQNFASFVARSTLLCLFLHMLPMADALVDSTEFRDLLESHNNEERTQITETQNCEFKILKIQ